MSKAKVFYFFLMLSIPFNFIVISSGGNLYLSTLLIFVIYSGLIVHLSKDKIHIFIVGLFTYLLLTSLVSFLFSESLDAKLMGIEIVKYFQLFSILSIAYYFTKYIKFDYMMNLFIIIMFIASVRYIYMNINILFLFSTISGERPNPEFIGSFNNFAMLIGVAILITLYKIKNILYRNLLLIYWFMILITTLSRGTIVSLIVTFLFFLIMKKSFRYYLKVLSYIFFSFVVLVYILDYFGYIEIIINLLENRYLSFLGEKTIDTYSSGRIEILNDIFYNHFLTSNILELLFGHGFGSIHFSLNPTFIYDTSHNNFIDILYKNGLLFFVLYISYLYLLFKKLVKKRSDTNMQLLLAILIYYNFSILMNPILFAIQVNWVYTLFLGITIYITKEKK